MIRLITTADPIGGHLIVAVLKRKSNKKYYIRYESFYSNKRIAKLLRDLADAIEKGAKDGDISKASNKMPEPG